MSPEWQADRLRSFGLPDDLSGKRVLDIGPWDGFYSFEMERRGAEVVAIDYVDLDTFRALRREFQSNVTYRRMEIYEVEPGSIGSFDVVLCLGVLYHLKHPLLALEKVCAITKDRCVVDTFVVDGEEWQAGHRGAIPYVEFYERAELAGQLDNWCGPTVGAVEAWIRAAGFARAEVLRVTNESACVIAHRKWGTLPPELNGPVQLAGLKSHHNRGRSFRSANEEYLELWCAWEGEEAPSIDSVYPEVDGFGVAPLACSLDGSTIQVSFRVPPGLCPGRHEVRVKIGVSGWSAGCEFYIDLPDMDQDLSIMSVQDGVSWGLGQVDWAKGGWMTVWVEGLSAEADPGNTTVFVGDIPHEPSTVLPDSGQINVRLRPVVAAGDHMVEVVHRGARSDSRDVRVLGTPPLLWGTDRAALSER